MKLTGYNSVNSWIATFGCFVIGFMGLIPVRLAGQFFVAIIDQYQTSRKLASLPIVVFGTIRTFGGPFAGHLGEIFGLRTIICIGSVLMAVGVGSCYFAQDVIVVTLLLGLIYGTGLAFTNCLVSSVIRQHFNKNISLANGVYLAGSCLGATILSPVIQYLITSYGISGMYLILSGILLNALPASMILKDPKNEDKNLNGTSENALPNFHKDGYEKVELSERRNTEQDSRKEDHDLYELSTQSTTNSMHSEKDYHSMTTDPNLHTYSEKNELDIDGTREHTEQNLLNKKVIHSNLPTSNEAKNKSCCNNFQLFLDPTFLLQMCLQSIHGFIIVLNWTIILDFGRDKGIATETGLYFVMFLPISEMLGNLCLNWITDHGFLSRINFCMICFIINAIGAGLIMWANSFALMMVSLMIFGFLTGAITSTLPGILMEFIDKDKQNMALASRFTLYGIFGLFKSLIIGFFRETLGSYNGIYYFIIVCCILCIIFSFLTPISASYAKKKRKTLNKVLT